MEMHGNDPLSIRMKRYESIEAGRIFIPRLPVLARIDGRCFSKFTKGLDRPYDLRLSNIMQDLTKYLVEESNACIGYTQSDEITLAFYAPKSESEVFFGGRIFKMVSQLAALASVHFNQLLSSMLPDKANKGATFDCRAWQVPTLEEGANVFLWREQDAVRNSIFMAAQSLFSHEKLHGKNTNQMQEMLFTQGVNWNDYPDFFKRGTYIQKRRVKHKFEPDAIENLPLQHEARKNPDLEIERRVINKIEMPVFSKVTNRADVVFFGAEPEKQ